MMPERLEDLRTHITTAYEAWGLPRIESGDRTSPETFAEILEKIASRIPERACALAPSTFDPAGPDLRGYPRPLQHQWPSCGELLRAFDCIGVMLRAPLFWQVEQSLFRTCKTAGAFVFVNDAANMPLGAAAIDTAHLDAVVTTRSDAIEFKNYLDAQNKKTPRLWVVIYEPSAALLTSERLFPMTAREVHLLPGVPLLTQCESLVRDGSVRFHMNDHLYEAGQPPTVTSIHDEPLPLWRFELPFSLLATGTCECGRPMVEVEAYV